MQPILRLSPSQSASPAGHSATRLSNSLKFYLAPLSNPQKIFRITRRTLPGATTAPAHALLAEMTTLWACWTRVSVFVVSRLYVLSMLLSIQRSRAHLCSCRRILWARRLQTFFTKPPLCLPPTPENQPMLTLGMIQEVYGTS